MYGDDSGSGGGGGGVLDKNYITPPCYRRKRREVRGVHV